MEQNPFTAVFTENTKCQGEEEGPQGVVMLCSVHWGERTESQNSNQRLVASR